ncbi:PaRep2b protein [Pyrobaculum aerophilum]|uniref:PaRep2b domain-containing protein n=2 Tax=Pyrobaculum aerophilum TaxID=13773 RepID=A0A371R5C9_9CREN|nr:PaRep2b protein [Pyrobaculum aerophilum]RFA99285.1 hypothetical protein CGL52_04560 [Pyrobaculum aerophilum]
MGATRGERAVAALLSLVTGGIFGVTVERALAEKGKHTVGALSIASAVRSAPKGFYDAFSSAYDKKEELEDRRLVLRITSLLADPLVRVTLTSRHDVEVRIEEKVENGKKRIYITFAEEGDHELLKTAWEAGKKLVPLWAEGKAVKLIKEVNNLAEVASSGSKPLEGLGGEEWERVVKAVEKTRKTVKKTAKVVAISALPTDAVLLPGDKRVYGGSSYLSQAFTYWALAKGKINLDKVYPSEEGLKPMWHVGGKYTETVNEILNKGRIVLNELLKSGVDLKTALADVNMNNELKTALEGAAGEFWRRVEELFSLWENAEKRGDVNTLNSLGKYLRVLLPLAYAVEAYRGGELSKEEAALAVICAVLYDGTVLRGEIWLTVGGPEKEESPIITRDHFTVFWLWALRELGFKPSAVYRGRGAHIIVFRGDELNELVKALVPALSTLHKLRDALAEFADAFRDVTHEVIKRKFGIEWAYDVKNERFFKKLEEVVTMAEDYVYKNVVVERGPLDASGNYPKTVVRFKLGGKEVAHITVYWTSNKLYATFSGSRKNAERLASVIRALGGEAEIKRVSEGWTIWLTTDGITAIRHDGWLKAVRGFVDELKGKGLISKERYEKIIKDIEAGPNTVKFAGVEFSAYYESNGIRVEYHPGNEASKNAVVNALKARDLKEGVHFTVTERGGYEIRMANESYTKTVEALAQSGLKEGEHYAVDGRRRVIRVKKDHKDAVANALKTIGLEEDKDFTVKSKGQYTIFITYDGLREIQRMALKGDAEAEHFIRELEDVLKRRYGDNAVNKLIEVLTPVREEERVELPLPVYDDKGNLVARIVDLKYEFVKGDQLVSQCAGEDCRLRVAVEYEIPSGERKQLKMEWYWGRVQKKKGKTTVTYYLEKAWISVKDDVEIAVLKALTGKGAKRGIVWLYADRLDALCQFKALKDAIDKWREGRPQKQEQN